MDWKKLSSLSQEAIRELQNQQVAKFFSHQLPYSPHYQTLFKNHNIRFEDIKTTDDLQRLPFTSKEDIAPTEDNPAKPREFILQPNEELIKKHASKGTLLKILSGKLTGKDVKRDLEREYVPIHLHFTTGRTALPTAFGYSERDLETFKETGARLLDVTGIDHNVFGINAFPYAPHLAFWLTAFAMQKIGMKSIQTGGGKIMGTRKIIDAIQNVKAGLVTFIPGYSYHLLRQAVREGGHDFSNVETIIFGGERVSPGLREKVKELMRELKNDKVKILASYAFTEGKTAWIQCAEESGYHLYPDIEFFEVIDKEGNRVPDGNPGELVYTALDWRGTTVVRYRTGDMTRGIEYQPCPHCGKTVPRIHPDIQRKSEIKEFHLTKVKGELVNLNAFYPLLSGNKNIEEWQVEILKKDNDPYGLDEIVVNIAPKANVVFGQLEGQVKQALHNETGITVNIREMPLQELLDKLGMETELKEKRFLDSRPSL